MSLSAGTRLGMYEILEPIGAGRMGEVYKGRDTRLDHTVALKVSRGRIRDGRILDTQTLILSARKPCIERTIPIFPYPDFTL